MSTKRGLRNFWSIPQAEISLGCLDCPEKLLCGGHTVSGAGFYCLDHCCNDAASCQIVCPNSHVFTDRIREVGGLEFKTPAIAPLIPPFCPPYIPMIFHGSALKDQVASSALAMPLYRFFDRFADCRFASREEVSQVFKVGVQTSLFLSGVAKDNEVEHWWNLGMKGRLKAIANLRRLSVAMVTTPNFSLMVDRPRWDDLHSMRRILNVYHEFMSEGQATALHVNGRTKTDFARWTDYIAAHPQVSHIAYEFTTGTRNPERMHQHSEWLTQLARGSGRKLGLLLRGGTQVAPLLSHHFDISFIDSSPFEKAQHREVAIVEANGQRVWIKRMTEAGTPVDELLRDNISVSRRWFSHVLRERPLAA